MFQWTPDVIRFRVDAAEYNGFDGKIAARILPYLPPGARVCDAGCGLGYLGLALAEGGARVTAVDQSPAALAVLRANAQKRGLQTIEAVEGDLFSLRPPAPYDAMAFCFFGHMEQTLGALKAQCRGKGFLIKKDWATHRFTLGEAPLTCFTFRQACGALDRLSIPYAAETFPLEMGQPFRSLKDALLFFRTFGQAQGGEAVTEAAVLLRLTATGSAQFPYYLPAERSLGMLVVDTGDIPGPL